MATRVAFRAVGVFIAINGQGLVATPVEASEAIFALAAGSMEEAQFPQWIRERLRAQA
jgi:prophage maintenance system killer protein